MAGPGGYLGQVVRDARPRPAASPGASGPSQPAAGPAEPLVHARLMESHPAERTPPASAGEPDRVMRHPDVQRPVLDQEPSAAPASAAPPEPSDEAPVDAPPDQSDVAASAPEDRPPIAPKTGHAHTVRDQGMPQPVTGPVPAPRQMDAVVPSVRVSGSTPRPAPFDVGLPGQQAARDALPIMAADDPDPPQSTTDSPASRAIAPRVRSDAALSGLARRPQSLAPKLPADSARAPQGPTDRSSVQVASGPVDVQIGEVEIVVQEPPAARAQTAARPARPPSPARYHIRRF